MLTKDQVNEINEILLNRFGRVFDRPKYRLTWSTTATEFRYVEGSEYYLNIKLRDVKTIQEMPKYPRDKDRWVLEILTEIPESLKHELVGDRGLTYEPLWVFKKGNEYQEPFPTYVYIWAYLSHYPMEMIMDSECDLWKMDKKEIELCYDMIDNEMPDLAIALKRGSAAFMDSSKRLIRG